MHRYSNFRNNGAKQMESNSPDDGENGEHNGIGFKDPSEIFIMQDAFLFATEPFDRFYRHVILLRIRNISAFLESKT